MFGRHRGTPPFLRLAFLALLVVPCALGAQVDLLSPQGQAGADAGGEIGITVESVGLNNMARPGDWTGIRLRLVDHGERQREVLVRVS
ncbi:MAG TPA: hypothetical protein VFF69_13665, partial [Phycisphaerales bacterium]|nr:hypothetical protein [Phycisphaerales bacterium]